MNSTIEQRVRELRAEGQLISSGTFTRVPPTPPAPPLLAALAAPTAPLGLAGCGPLDQFS